MFFAPGRRTSRSGRSRPSSPSALCCSKKSQWSNMPAISTTRFSWISPQRPRTCGPAEGLDQVAGLRLQLPLRIQQRLDLFAQAAVGPGPGLLHLADLRVHLLQRFFHRFDHLLDRRLAFFQVAFGRLLKLLHGAFARSRNDWLLLFRASAARALKASASFSWAWFSRPNFSSACLRSWSRVVASWASCGIAASIRPPAAGRFSVEVPGLGRSARRWSVLGR